MPKRLFVSVINHEKSPARETRIFETSPVTIGRSPDCALRLDDPRISLVQGALFFTGNEIKYVDGVNAASASVGEQPAITYLRSNPSLRLGPFEISAAIDDADEDTVPDVCALDRPRLIAEVSRLLGTVGTSGLRVLGDNPYAMAGFIASAIRVVDIVSLVIFELRRKAIGWHGREAPWPVPESWDPEDITAYLLDPDESEARIEAVRQHFINLVHQDRLSAPAISEIAQA